MPELLRRVVSVGHRRAFADIFASQWPKAQNRKLLKVLRRRKGANGAICLSSNNYSFSTKDYGNYAYFYVTLPKNREGEVIFLVQGTGARG